MDTLTHTKNANKKKDIGEHKNNTYQHYHNEVNNHNHYEYHNPNKSITLAILDHLLGNLCIQPGSGGLLPGIGGEEDDHSTVA